MLAPTQWMNRRSWPRTLTISVWLVASCGSILSALVSTLWASQGLGGEPAEDVVADAGTDRGRDPQPGEVDRRVGGSAADVQHQLVDRDQLAGPGQMVKRRAEMVGHDQPSTDDGGPSWR